MRIAYVCLDPGVPAFGRKGCSVHVQEVIRALERTGVRTELFAARLDGQAPADLAYMTVHHVPVDSTNGSAAFRELAAVRANDEIRDLLCARGPFDAVYERHSLWSHVPMEYAREQDVPGLLEINSPLLVEQAQYRQLIHRATAQHTVRGAFAAATYLLPVSEGVADYVRSFDGTAGKIHIVPNGVDSSRFAHLSIEPRDEQDPFTVGFIGTLKPWHGVDLLLDAFCALRRVDPGARLLIVGDGPERKGLTERIRSLELEHAVTMTGAVDPADIPDLLGRMHVAVAPYPQLDGFYFSPLKIYEYMASGRAIVASKIGQMTSVLDDDRTALLVAPGHVDELAAALIRLQEDEALRCSIGRAARSVAAEHHTWDAVARRILGLIAAHARPHLGAVRRVV